MSDYAEGWYPVPETELERYHDGSRWTDKYRAKDGGLVAPPAANTASAQAHFSRLPPPPTPTTGVPYSSGNFGVPSSEIIRIQNEWVEQSRRSGVAPEEAYAGMVAQGRSKSSARRLAERIIPEGQSHPVLNYLFYFSFGFAALGLAFALHAILDYLAILDSSSLCERASFYGERSCQSGTDALKRSFAGWFGLFLVVAPIAAVTGKMIFNHDKTEKYAILSSERFVLNNILLVTASVIAVLRLLSSITGVVSSLIFNESQTSVNFAHAATTLTIAGLVVMFCVWQYKKWRTTWGMDQPTPQDMLLEQEETN
jgi:hypothetical protein